MRGILCSNRDTEDIFVNNLTLLSPREMTPYKAVLSPKMSVMQRERSQYMRHSNPDLTMTRIEHLPAISSSMSRLPQVQTQRQDRLHLPDIVSRDHSPAAEAVRKHNSSRRKRREKSNVGHSFVDVTGEQVKNIPFYCTWQLF